METMRSEARALGVAWDRCEASRAEHCDACGLPVSNSDALAPAARVAGWLVCCSWCARQVVEAVTSGAEVFEPADVVTECEVCGAPRTHRECLDCVSALAETARQEADADAVERGASWDGEDDEHDGAGSGPSLARCSSCGEIGCLGDCEQGSGPEGGHACDQSRSTGRCDCPPCEGCAGGCLECEELNMRDEPTTAATEAEGDITRGLALGARVEVFIGRAWRVCVVVGEYMQRDGAGTLFESEPRRVLTLAQVGDDGRAGSAFTLGNGHGVRMVEPGLFT